LLGQHGLGLVESGFPVQKSDYSHGIEKQVLSRVDYADCLPPWGTFHR
jgi:hypothetical protein